MSKKIISKKTLNEFREFLVGWTLREIMDEFNAVGLTPDKMYDPPMSGERRCLVEQYYHGLNLSSHEDVKKLVSAFENILHKAIYKGPHDKEQLDYLLACLARDGFSYADGKLIGAAGAVIDSDSPLAVTSDDELKLWEPDCLRVFLSHKAEYKKEAAALKEHLLSYGASCFVAHEDIEPTAQWLGEIEKALFSMDVLLPLLTAGFSNSNWTDQEVGVAIGRRIPVYPVKVGMDPYGFIGKYQAVSAMRKNIAVLARELVDVFVSKELTQDKMKKALVSRFEKAESFNHANSLIAYLHQIDELPDELIDRIEKAPEINRQVGEAYDVQRLLPQLLKKLRKR